MPRPSLLLAALAALLPACGGSVISPGDAAGSASGSSSGSGGAPATSSTGAGGASSSSGLFGDGGAGGASASSSASSGGFGGACDTAFIDVAGDGPTQTFLDACKDVWGTWESNRPVGYYFLGGGAVGELHVVGCNGPNAGAASLHLVGQFTDMPTSASAQGSYTDANGHAWSMSSSATITLGTEEKVGGVFEGSYEAVVSDGNAEKKLSGTFRVCHVDDLAAP